MARIDTLTNFLTDVATAIKTKRGGTSVISAVNFDAEILNLPRDIDHKVLKGLIGGATIDIEIPYEDEDIIVLNKPPLMPVHESRNHIGDTLSNFVAYHCGEDMAFRAVYRLDRDTSGLVLVAKNELAAAKLAGKIKKDYYAVVDGTVENDGIVDAPIARCGDSIIKRKVDENGETAITEYFPIKSNGNATLVKFNLKTGRTHQIRVHMEHIGHSLLGDKLYGGDCSMISRQASHCKDICFTHPITEKPMHITCDFPNDMKNLV